jgi:hypothetical protein
VSKGAPKIDWNRSGAHPLEGEEDAGLEIPVATSSQKRKIDPKLAIGQPERIDRKEPIGQNAAQGPNGPIVRSVRNGPTGPSEPIARNEPINQNEPIDQNVLKERNAPIAQRGPSEQSELVGLSERIDRTGQAGLSGPKVQTAQVDQNEHRTEDEAHVMIAADATAAFAIRAPVTNVVTCQHIPNRFPSQQDSVPDCTMKKMMMTSDFVMILFS